MENINPLMGFCRIIARETDAEPAEIMGILHLFRRALWRLVPEAIAVDGAPPNDVDFVQKLLHEHARIRHALDDATA